MVILPVVIIAMVGCLVHLLTFGSFVLDSLAAYFVIWVTLFPHFLILFANSFQGTGTGYTVL